MFFYRWLRIWPTYMICLLIFWQWTNYWSYGPLWFSYEASTNGCSNHTAWQNALFIDVYMKDAGNCFGWGWYLANDINFFLLTPIILILFIKNRKAGLSLTIILFVTSISIGIATAIIN